MGDVCNVVFEEGFEWQEKGKNWENWVDFALLGYALLVYALLGFALLGTLSSASLYSGMLSSASLGEQCRNAEPSKRLHAERSRGGVLHSKLNSSSQCLASYILYYAQMAPTM